LSENNPVQPRILRHQIRDWCRDRILSGQLAPGERLVESALAAELGVSRPTLREALRDLEAAYLVQTIPYRGTFVAGLSVEEAKQLYAVIRSLEQMAWQLAISQADNALIHKLEHSLGQMQRACEAQDLFELARADMEFHEAVFKAADNRYLLRLWKTLLPAVCFFFV
jgi:DNA-binding GntR family transcriptional regulator